MGKIRVERVCAAKMIAVKFICVMALFLSEANAQQFNSDSWLSKAHGTITLIPTY